MQCTEMMLMVNLVICSHSHAVTAMNFWLESTFDFTETDKHSF